MKDIPLDDEPLPSFGELREAVADATIRLSLKQKEKLFYPNLTIQLIASSANYYFSTQYNCRKDRKNGERQIELRIPAKLLMLLLRGELKWSSAKVQKLIQITWKPKVHSPTFLKFFDDFHI